MLIASLLLAQPFLQKVELSSLRVPNPHVLLFSKTKGFRHDSIETARDGIIREGSKEGMTFEWTEDSVKFSDENLKKFDSIVFLMTTGDVLNEDEQKVLERFVENGKGWVGVHSASDTEYEWPWYAGLVGAYFKSHPSQHHELTMNVESQANPGSYGLPTPWKRKDEWYDFRSNPRSKVNVLLSLDEKEYKKEAQDHPIAWWHWQGKGKAWYTGMGHTKESYSEAPFMKHLMGGIRWASQHSDEKEVSSLKTTSEGLQTSVKAKRFRLHAEVKSEANQEFEIRFGRLTTLNLGESTRNILMAPNDWNEVDMVFEAFTGKVPDGKPTGRLSDIRINGNLQLETSNVFEKGIDKKSEQTVLFKVKSGKVQVRNVQLKVLN